MTPPAAVLAHGEAGADPVTTVLVVPGMHCAGCMAKVERSLHAVAGVSEARVNLTARQVRVAHDPAVTMPQLMDALTSVGFASQPRGDTAAEAPSAVKPLLAPLAVAYGYDKVMFGIIMIVNLEIGFLTPPVGLNLLVAMSVFKRKFGELVAAAVPFIALMLGCLAVIAWQPWISLSLLGR